MKNLFKVIILCILVTSVSCQKNSLNEMENHIQDKSAPGFYTVMSCPLPDETMGWRCAPGPFNHCVAGFYPCRPFFRPTGLVQSNFSECIEDNVQQFQSLYKVGILVTSPQQIINDLK